MDEQWPIIGHDNVKKFLSGALKAGRLHHAYLFLGPAKVGKMTVAKIFAQSALCEHGEKGRPCGQCVSCKRFLQGNHPDISILSSEENTVGVELVRGLISDLSHSSLLGKARIGIIDGAHKLTTEAQNALLKTLEEPKASKIIILISENCLLSTTASRVQTVKFYLAQGSALMEFLRKEGLEHRRIQELVALASGRPGIVLEFLRNGDKIKEYRDEAQKFLSLFGETKPFNVFAFDVLGKDLERARERWRELSEIGTRVLREMLLLKLGLGDQTVYLSEMPAEKILNYSPSKLAFLINHLQTLRQQVRSNIDPRFALENFYLLIH
ncbi:MAG: DNA polymerase III subunit [Thermodesulfovibrionia bacterium]|nr:DNA polymerase III subunit [Thermodesulfovibrionia bacterium]